MLQDSYGGTLLLIITCGLFFLLALLALLLLPLRLKFGLKIITGLIINGLLVCIGMALTWQQDIRHHQQWYGNSYQQNDGLLICVTEPLITKPKTYKIAGRVQALLRNDSVIPCKGHLLVYLSRDTTSDNPPLKYGDRFITRQKIQLIRNSGNPGAFNYQRYTALQQIFHQVFIKEGGYTKLPGHQRQPFRQFIFSTREYVLNVLRKNIGHNKEALGVAEALLIGYTNDLDKDLLQAYSNTGVVHIIAISGMHLALIYFLLSGLLKKIPFLYQYARPRALLVLAGLWMFALLTGAAASVLRAAVMFTFITIGDTVKKKSCIYNSLAAAAFLMLVYNPGYLWEVGFQLSYLAVISIVVFQKPVYQWFAISNSLLDKTWKLAAISLAAQVLTFPVCIYYFHQFPNLFLVTNMVAVPLSGLVLYIEIALVCFSWFTPVAAFAGKLVGWLVSGMNAFISRVNQLPFAVWDQLPATIATTLLLYALVILLATWLLNKYMLALKWALFCGLGFTVIHACHAWQWSRQQKMIVYQVPKHRAIDFIAGRRYFFVGDSAVREAGVLQHFHLKPARIHYQVRPVPLPARLQQFGMAYQFNDKRIVLVDDHFRFNIPEKKLEVHIIVLSNNPNITITQLAAIFNSGCYVFDASNSLWKIDKWKKECEELLLRSYSVPEQGAFVWDITQ